MKITAQQYISNSKDSNSFTKVFRHIFDSTDKKVGKEGDIYGLLNISSQQKVQVERISKFVWDSIVDGYLYSPATATNESLKEAISQGVKKVKELIANDKDLEETGVDVSFVVVLVKEEGVYVGIFGESDIYTFKKGSLVNIYEILSEKRANTAGVVLDESDVLMISTQKLLSNVSEKFSQLKKKEDFLQMLNSLGKNLSGTSGVLYFTKEERKKSVEKKQISISPVKNIKEGAQKFLKPMARVEKIKRPKDQKVFENFEKKIGLEKSFNKVKEFVSKVKGKVQPVCRKISVLLSEKWEALKEKVLLNIGKKRWYKRIASKFSANRIGGRRSPTVKGMRIDDYKVRDLRGKRFKLLFMFLSIVVLLTLGINFTVKMKQAKEVSRLANESFTKVEDLLRKSENNFVTDRTSAETYLFQAEKELGNIVSELNEDDSIKYDELKKRILTVGDTLYKRVGVVEEGNLRNFLDVRLSFGEGSEISDIAIYKDDSGNEYLFVSDSGKNAVHRVSLFDKSVKTLPDNDGLVVSPEHVYVGVNGVYAFGEKSGVLRASFTDDGWFSPFVELSGLSTKDIKSTEITEMVAWTLNDNVYFMSRDRKSLLKSTVAYENRYGLAYSYIPDDRFEISTDMVADISIYVTISEEPHLLRYNYSFYENKYNEAPLGVLGFDGNYGNLTKAFTGDSLDYSLYLFDADGKRFLRFQKPIEAGADMRHTNQISLLYQYVYRGEKDSTFANVKNFVVDFSESSAYILDDSVIWKLGL
jgi:CBS domain-containing protein